MFKHGIEKYKKNRNAHKKIEKIEYFWLIFCAYFFDNVRGDIGYRIRLKQINNETDYR
jgi:hypothetical protein